MNEVTFVKLIKNKSHFIFSKKKKRIYLYILRDNPDAVFELLDEIGSDFEYDSNEDNTWEHV